MKTSLELDSNLAKEARAYAVRANLTFRALCELALKEFLRLRKRGKRNFKLQPVIAEASPTSEFLSSSWNELRRLNYQGRGE